MLQQRISDSAKIRVRRMLASVGLEIGSYNGSFAEHRARLLRELGVATLWDTGAHVGQYGTSVRGQGFKGTIISFEPSNAAHAALIARAADDSSWTVINAAVGKSDGRTTLNVSDNGQSSSLLPMLPQHVVSAPRSVYVGKEDVDMVSLDSVLRSRVVPEPFALKLDVQGYELEALAGAAEVADKSVLLEIELSLAPLYSRGAGWEEVVKGLSDTGWRLCDIERVHWDPGSGDLLQVNGLFRRILARDSGSG